MNTNHSNAGHRAAKKGSLRIGAVTLGLLLAAGFVMAEADVPAAPQADLEAYLTEHQTWPGHIKGISSRVFRPGAAEPLDELVAWTKDWGLQSPELKFGVVLSVIHYCSALPDAEKAQRYLTISKEFRGDQILTYHLSLQAGNFVARPQLEKEVLALLKSQDPADRSRGILMGKSLLPDNHSLLEQYLMLLKTDSDLQTRVNILFSVVNLRTKAVALAGLAAFLNDGDVHVRDWGFNCLRMAAEVGTIGEEELPAVLAPMIKTDKPNVRVGLGWIAARVTTDRALLIDDSKLTDEVLMQFVKLAKQAKIEPGNGRENAMLSNVWRSWWGKMVSNYAKPCPPPVE